MRPLLILIIAAACAAPAPPRLGIEGVPGRPTLEDPAFASRDTNDWHTYYDYGVSLIRRRPLAASEALYWATRLNPSSYKPLIARWEALRRRAEVSDTRLTVEQQKQIDTLLFQAFVRRPFAEPVTAISFCPQYLDRIKNPMEAGITAFYFGCWETAIIKLAAAIPVHPDRLELRFLLARAYHSAGNSKNVVIELRALIDSLRAREVREVQHVHESKEMVEYVIAYEQLHPNDVIYPDTASAIESLRRSITENLGFYPAYAMLGNIAWARRDTANATRQYEQAVLANPLDGELRYNFGTVLIQAQRFPEAVEQFRKAIELEPYFADSYYNLGIALERSGQREAAVPAYREFLARAPRVLAKEVERVKERIATLSAASPSPRP